MPKRGEPMSDELKAKLAAGRAAAKAKKDSPQKQTSPLTENNSTSELSVETLTKMVLELQNALLTRQPEQTPQPQQSEVRNGRLVGVTEKYSVDPSRYEDPREKLRSEARLQRIAFDANYELDWEVGVTSYETKDGVNMKEPKFVLKLNQIVADDDGEPTTQRIGKAQLIFFEDPATAIVVANQNGLDVDEVNEKDFLNDMRYIRTRDWLFECFWPPKQKSIQQDKREIVVGGQVVSTWEVAADADKSVKMNFNALGDSKLRA